jgi:hypothetical protein
MEIRTNAALDPTPVPTASDQGAARPPSLPSATPPNDERPAVSGESAGGMPERPSPAAVGPSSCESASSASDGSAAKRNQELRHVPIEQVRYDKGAYTRLKIDDARVNGLAQLKKDGIPVEPGEAVYDGEVYWVTDGVYRFLAEKLCGSSTIALLVTEGTREDATWQALAANQANGQPLTSTEKQRAVTAALRHPKASGMTDRAIAEHLRVSHATVSRCRQRLSQRDSGPKQRVDRKGRTMNVENIGKTKRTSADRRLPEPEAPTPPASAEAKAAPAGATGGGPVIPKGVPGSDRPPPVGSPDGGANRVAHESLVVETREPAAGAAPGASSTGVADPGPADTGASPEAAEKKATPDELLTHLEAERQFLERYGENYSELQALEGAQRARFTKVAGWIAVWMKGLVVAVGEVETESQEKTPAPDGPAD